MFQSVLIAALLFAPVHVEHPEGESAEETISPLVVTEIQSFGELQLANGIEALDSGDSSLALRLLADYLARYPSSDLAPNARYLAARAALEEKEPLKALAWLTDLDRLIPEVEDFVLAAKATAHRHLGQWPGNAIRLGATAEKIPEESTLS